MCCGAWKDEDMNVKFAAALLILAAAPVHAAEPAKAETTTAAPTCSITWASPSRLC